MFPSLYGAVSQGAAAASWWVVAGKTCVAAYQPIGAASLAASYTNLANPGTYDAAPGVAPTWASGTGWTFNGSTQYLTTGVVPASGWSAIARFSDAADVSVNVAFGINNTITNARFYIRVADGASNRRLYGYGNAVAIVANDLVAGVVAITNTNGHLNGSVDATYSPTWIATVIPIAVGALQIQGGVVSSFFNGKIQAVAIYSDTLSGAEVATLSAAMAALT